MKKMVHTNNSLKFLIKNGGKYSLVIFLFFLIKFCLHQTGPKGAKVLVYEYVQNGSLLEYIVGKFQLVNLYCYIKISFLILTVITLLGRGGRILTWRQRVNIAIGAAKGKFFSSRVKIIPMNSSNCDRSF